MSLGDAFKRLFYPVSYLGSRRLLVLATEDMIGAIKIKDGLFIGDSFAAQVSVII